LIGCADAATGTAVAYVMNKTADRNLGSPAAHLIEAVDSLIHDKTVPAT
jgi:hypothetical protein